MSATDDRRDAALRMLEHEIGFLFRRIRRGIAERATQVHPELTATSYSLLSTLHEFGPRRAADLAEMFGLDKGAVSRIVHQLLELGLIARSPDPADGRASILSVTEDGDRRMVHMHEERRRRFGTRLAEWAPEEMEDLAERLGRFNRATDA